MKRIQIDLEIIEGGRFRQPFIWESGPTEATAVPVDLTGNSALMSVRKKLTDQVPLLDYSTAGGILEIADQVTNKGQINLDDLGLTTPGICADHKDFTGVYDLFIYAADGTPRVCFYGPVKTWAAAPAPGKRRPKMSTDVIKVVTTEVQVVKVITEGPSGPAGPQGDPGPGYNLGLEQFYQAVAAGTCTVCAVGTSLTEAVEIQLERQNSYIFQIMRGLRSRFPNCEFTLINLSLGARGLDDYVDPDYIAVTFPDDPTSNFYRGAGDPDVWPGGAELGKSWRDHARDANADLFIIDHGLNDLQFCAQFWASLVSAIAYANTWPKVPSILLSTNILATTAAAPYDALQPIYEARARLTRLAAETYGCGLIDPNRYWRLARDGKDELRPILEPVSDLATWELDSGSAPSVQTANAITAAAVCILKSTAVQHYNAEIDLDYTPSNSTTQVKFGVRRQPADAWTKGLYVSRSGSVLEVYEYENVVQSWTVATAAVGVKEDLRIRYENHRVMIWRNGTLMGVVPTTTLWRGSMFINVRHAALTNISLDSGDFFGAQAATHTNAELIGTKTVEDWDAGDHSIGGNSVKHPTRIGTLHVFGQAVVEFVAKL